MEIEEILRDISDGNEKVARKIISELEEFYAPRKSDYAVVLGCEPISAIRRADIAADFYKHGYAKKLVVSGGVTHNLDGVEKAEYEIMKERLVEKGVSSKDIIEEHSATDTVSNMTYSLAEILKADDIYRNKVADVTVITEPFHILRSYVLARLLFPEFICVYGYTQNTENGIDEKLTNEINLLRLLARNLRRKY